MSASLVRAPVLATSPVDLRYTARTPPTRADDIFGKRRVAGNKGARTPGVDGLTVANVEGELGLPDYLEDLQRVLKMSEFRPLLVRERKIPKPGGNGKVRKLGIPTVSDRVVQAALKLVLEPIFEADFLPVSYGFGPMRRAYDAVAEIHRYGTRGYRWVLDADIEACFDSIDHTALMDRVRARVKDKRVLRLVKAFQDRAGSASPAICSWTSETGMGASGSSSVTGTASSPPHSTPSSPVTAQPSSRLRRKAHGPTRSPNDGYAQPVPSAPTDL
ncbi:reverse transcriptase domain-containing protein [Streptomyces melanosporofaciens]|uniref:reverse transcriptase domain-containing protein n=1 Tax=Streptomyces sp. NPDC001520 TaxID=3364581 RepID=UPI003674F46A